MLIETVEFKITLTKESSGYANRDVTYSNPVICLKEEFKPVLPKRERVRIEKAVSDWLFNMIR